MHKSLGYDIGAFLSKKWDLVSALVLEEYRASFVTAIGEYLQGRSRLPSLIKVRAASVKLVDCGIGTFEPLSGQAGECVITCRFAFGSAPAPLTNAARREETAALRAGRQSEVRGDIARVLHETVAQELFLCKGKLIELRGASGERKRARFLTEALDYLDESTAGFRGVLSSLSTSEPTSPDLKGALMGVMRWARKKYGLDIKLRVRAALPALDGTAHDLVLSSARELLTNVFKHSGQKIARVAIQPEGRGARLDVADFGTGISRASGSPSRRNKGLGLSGIRGRAGKLGGSVDVESNAGMRTRVSVILPGCGGGGQRPQRGFPRPADQARPGDHGCHHAGHGWSGGHAADRQGKRRGEGHRVVDVR